ncbi:MAG: glutamyl-tRNA reductase [Myxococcota bacterium]
MHLVTVGLSHHTAPVELRERLAPRPGQIPEFLAELRSHGLGREAVLLSTCNRVELYTVPGSESDPEALARWMLSTGGVNHRNALKHVYRYHEQDALHHLLRVISSLDSMIVGEPQIVAQFKEAYRIAVEAKATGPILHRVLDGALNVAKKVRSETEIAQEAVSIGRAGVELARQVLGDIGHSAALLIGAGAHGKLVAQNLIGYGLTELVIANRTFSRASDLAARFGATAIQLDDIHRYLDRVDIVLTSTGAGRILLSKRDLAPLMRKRRYRPLVLIDLSVPRVIDTNVNELDSVFRFDVDDLSQIADRGKQRRLDAAAEAEQIISTETERVWREIIATTHNRLIGALPRRAEAIRRAELVRAQKVLDKLSKGDRKAIDAMTRAIVKKILHKPMLEARQLAEAGESEKLAMLLSSLTDLTEDEKS